MKDDFSELWQAQTLVEHNSKKLLGMWRKRLLKDRLAYAFAAFMALFTIYYATFIGTSENHWIIKSWVLFWSTLCVGYFVSHLWLQRNSIKSLAEDSSSQMISQMRDRAEFRLKVLKLLKPLPILLVVLLAVFNAAYLWSFNIEPEAWAMLVLRNLFVVGIAVVIWFYSKRKMASFKNELEWLNDYEARGEDTMSEQLD